MCRWRPWRRCLGAPLAAIVCTVHSLDGLMGVATELFDQIEHLLTELWSSSIGRRRQRSCSAVARYVTADLWIEAPYLPEACQHLFGAHGVALASCWLTLVGTPVRTRTRSTIE